MLIRLGKGSSTLCVKTENRGEKALRARILGPLLHSLSVFSLESRNPQARSKTFIRHAKTVLLKLRDKLLPFKLLDREKGTDLIGDGDQRLETTQGNLNHTRKLEVDKT